MFWATLWLAQRNARRIGGAFPLALAALTAFLSSIYPSIFGKLLNEERVHESAHAMLAILQSLPVPPVALDNWHEYSNTVAHWLECCYTVFSK